ncbi:unnamed protein product, partial [Choristocarpus tenellus]
MERCSDTDGSFNICDVWVAPYTQTAVAIPSNSTYLRVQQCTFTEDSPECLSDPIPVEIYGSPILWPSSVDINYSVATRCQK